jgi:hypothetical protein
VNYVLSAIGEAPVNRWQGEDVGADVIQARQFIDTALRTIQMVGWEYNTEEGYALSRDSQGYVYVPGNALRVDNAKFGSTGAVAWRGRKLYDKTNRSYTFTADVTADITFAFPFDELPQHVRSLVLLTAAHNMTRYALSSSTVAGYSEADLAQAWVVAKQIEAENADTNMFRQDPAMAWAQYDNLSNY